MSKNKNPTINFIIHIGVYPFDVMISINESDEQLEKRLRKYGIGKEENDCYLYSSETCNGRAAMFANNSSLIRLRQLPRTSSGLAILAHEIFHITHYILDRVGIKLKKRVSDEAFAYLTGYLTMEIYKKLNKYY